MCKSASLNPVALRSGIQATTTGFYYGVGNNKYWYNLGTYDGGTLRGVAQTQVDLFPSPQNTPSNWTAQPPGNFMYIDGGKTATANYQTYAFGQSISGLTPGQTYVLTFLAAYAPEYPAPVDTVYWEANLGGTANFALNGGADFSGFTGGDTVDGPVVDIPANGLGWVPVTLDLTATASTETSLVHCAGNRGAALRPYHRHQPDRGCRSRRHGR